MFYLSNLNITFLKAICNLAYILNSFSIILEINEFQISFQVLVYLFYY